MVGLGRRSEKILWSSGRLVGTISPAGILSMMGTRSKAELGKVESNKSLGKLIFFNRKVSFTSATLCSRTNYYQITITPGGSKPHELCLFAPSALYSAGDIPVVGGSTIHPWKHSD